ncbi:MAG: DUF2190 family protein [Planctomycetes bacterium]|nr:DUF2190 family protein [Planctomycetota bacterium]
MSFVKSPITLVTGEDLAAKRLVKLSSGTAVLNTATATDEPIGVNDYYVADGYEASIMTLSEDGTLEMTAAGVISLDADVFAAADGKVQALPTDGGTYRRIGTCMEAATADGVIIEVLPYAEETTQAVDTALTAAAPVVVPGSINTIDSTSNAVDGTLADDTIIGRQTRFVMTEASNSSTITIANHETSDPEVATFDAVDEYLVLEWSGTEYVTIKATATFV